MSPTPSELQHGFRIGDWTVIPDRGLLQNRETSAHLEPMVMDVLLLLVSNQGEVVSKHQLIDKIWGGRATTDESISAKIAVLRNKLGDSSKNPTFIETVQKRGYRLRASVKIRQLKEKSRAGARSARTVAIAAGALLVVAALVAYTSMRDPINSIGVLQFENLSNDRNQHQYIVDGFTEELVVSLGRAPEVRVTRGPAPDVNETLQDVAKNLDVDALIRGSLRTDGEKIRITVEMMSASGFQLWADIIDGEAGEIFQLQERVAASVRDNVLGFDPPVTQDVSRPKDEAAYDAYLVGLQYLARRDLASLEAAVDEFEQTIQRDPQFGPAYMRQAIALLLIADYKPAEMQDIYDGALTIARRGAQNDEDIRAPIQLIHAFVHHQRGYWEEAASAFDVAFGSRTKFSVIHHWHSRYLGDLGFVEESLLQARTARAIDPKSQVLTSRLAIAYMWSGDMQSAGHYFDLANKLGVGVPDHHLGYAAFLIRNGNIEAARESVRLAFRMAQKSGAWIDPVFASLENPADAGLRDVAIDTIQSGVDDGNLPPYVSMMIWALFDEPGRAMQIAVHEATERGVIYELELIFTEEFAAFRQHPDFAGLLENLGLTRHWANMGCSWVDDRLACN